MMCHSLVHNHPKLRVVEVNTRLPTSLCADTSPICDALLPPMGQFLMKQADEQHSTHISETTNSIQE